jgi:hypothetical protein
MELNCEICGFVAEVKPQAVTFDQADLKAGVNINHRRYSLERTGRECVNDLFDGAN